MVIYENMTNGQVWIKENKLNCIIILFVKGMIPNVFFSFFIYFFFSFSFLIWLPICRCVSPVLSGVIFSLTLSETTLKIGFPLDYNFVFVMFSVTYLVSLLIVACLPKSINKQKIIEDEWVMSLSFKHSMFSFFMWLALDVYLLFIYLFIDDMMMMIP